MDGRLKLFETLYRYDLDVPVHIRLIRSAAEQYWHKRGPVAFMSGSQASHGGFELTLQTSDQDVIEPSLRAWLGAAPDLEAWFAAPPVYGRAMTLARQGALNLPLTTAWLAHMQARDLFGFFTGTSEAGLVALFAWTDAKHTGARAQAHWQPIAAHLAAAWRIRQRLRAGASMSDLIDVALHPDGRIRDTQIAIDAALRDALGAAVRERECRTASAPLWPELLAGRWTLIDRVEAEGQRSVVAIRNMPLAQHVCRLTAQEATALDMARTGAANKEIALNMGLAPSSVTRLLQAVSLKLNASLADLIQLLSTGAVSRCDLTFGHTDVSVFSPAVAAALPDWQDRLSAAETSVVSAVLRGQSNDEIAAERGSSVRTVVNQLASVFEKLAIRSRRELFSLPLPDPRGR
jgi:DNA-binding NarL/FixJ family response regulator